MMDLQENVWLKMFMDTSNIFGTWQQWWICKKVCIWTCSWTPRTPLGRRSSGGFAGGRAWKLSEEAEHVWYL
jgi:hypothetical protein